MACGGFTCSKNALAALNVLYILVAFILIGVAATARVMAVITDIGIMGGIIACGVFLLIIAIIGLVGAIKHHQVLLFFYMIILFLLFLVQFSIACACLAMNETQQEMFLRKGWKLANEHVRNLTQYELSCCGFDKETQNPINPFNTTSSVDDDEKAMYHPNCDYLEGCHGSDAPCCNGLLSNTTEMEACPILPCLDKIRDQMKSGIKLAGGIGLFFSFTEIIGVWLALRFRNQKDPRANPSAFL